MRHINTNPTKIISRKNLTPNIGSSGFNRKRFSYPMPIDVGSGDLSLSINEKYVNDGYLRHTIFQKYEDTDRQI